MSRKVTLAIALAGSSGIELNEYLEHDDGALVRAVRVLDEDEEPGV